MNRRLRLFGLSAFLVFSASCSQPSAETNVRLNGNHVASISKTFLEEHFSKPRFDDARSREMLDLFLDRFDPGHFYFLQSDIAEFQQSSSKLDDFMRERKIEFAFTVFDRLKQRIQEHGKIIHRLLDGPFDLKSEDSRVIERKNQPYPKDAAGAERLWAKKLKFEMLGLVLNDRSEDQARDDLHRRYRSQRKRLLQLSHNEVVSAYLNSFTATFDPHSSYLTPDDLENFNISLRLSLEGIGATLRWEDGYTVVTSIIAGGAAYREGSLKPEDRILAVAQGEQGEFEDVSNYRLIDVVKLIRGKRGTLVRLALLRDTGGPVEKRREIAIVRDKIVLKEGEAQPLIRENKRVTSGAVHRIGIIKLPSFYVDFSGKRNNRDNFKSSSRDVASILRDFQQKKVDGVVLDLRNNGGGGLEEAVSVAGLFLKKGSPVVLVKYTNGSIQSMPNKLRPIYSGPLLVLTNRYSASASEIVAGALKDYGRAILVGDRTTFGKGTVQNIIHLRRGLGALKTTVAKFYRPGSSSTQNLGVTPHVVLPSLNNQLKIGEESLKNPLPWDSIAKRSLKKIGDISPFLPIISERSRQRIAKSPDFQKVKENVATYLKTRKGRTTVTVSQMIEDNRRQNVTREKSLPRTAAAGPSGCSEQEKTEMARGGLSKNEIETRCGTTTAATPDGKAKNGKPETNDFTLDEAVEILADYIELTVAQPQQRVVNQ